VPLLHAWESFYVIVGSSAAALTGLQFVVMALIADIDLPANPTNVGAFSTPTIVHFSAALLVSAIVTAPWPAPLGPAVLLATSGTVGVLYSLIVARRALKQEEYEPVFEDWAFHVALPAAAYGVMAAAGGLLHLAPARSLFGLGAAVLGLVFIGIHNAWDTVTYLVIARRQDRTGS
jgi:hypothetical protein